MRGLTDRRQFIGLVTVGVLTLAAPLPAVAQSTAQAQQLVERAVADINKTIDSGKSETAMYRDFERIFATYGDVPTIARYALGVEARSASPAQLREFTTAFQGYMARKYGSQFREFIGGRIDVDSARQVKSFIEVKTTAHLRGEAPFDVTFLVSDKSGSSKFFNLFIEGVNMLLAERTEIGAMLDRRGGNIDQMIADLKTAG